MFKSFHGFIMKYLKFTRCMLVLSYSSWNIQYFSSNFTTASWYLPSRAFKANCNLDGMMNQKGSSDNKRKNYFINLPKLSLNWPNNHSVTVLNLSETLFLFLTCTLYRELSTFSWSFMDIKGTYRWRDGVNRLKLKHYIFF